jgi:AraC-like DNA-binding protein
MSHRDVFLVKCEISPDFAKRNRTFLASAAALEPVFNMPRKSSLTPEFDPVAALEHLVYFSEEPVDVPSARRLLGCDDDAPPTFAAGIDFPQLPRERYIEVQAWARRIAELPVAGFTRTCTLATMPVSVYWFGWTERGLAVPDPDAVGRAIVKLGATARAAGLPKPVVGVSPAITDWVDLRRPLTRATVGFRLAASEGAAYRVCDDVERYLAVPRTAPRSVGALVNAVARGDAAAARREARRIADIFLAAYISPIATLRTRFLSTLLQCGDAVEAAGVTEHVVARWADHRLRELWQVYSLPATARVFIESIGQLAELASGAADSDLPRAVAGAKSLLIATWNETYSASYLARETGIGVGRLSRLFKKSVGCTIPQFRNKLRMEKAVEMLKTTDKPITVVALECGFTNLTHFHRVFRQANGRGPREFRNAVSEDE